MIVCSLDNDKAMTSYLIVVVEENNFRRMEKGDPITLTSGRLGGSLPEVTYPDRLVFVFAYAGDKAGAMYQAIQEGNTNRIIELAVAGMTMQRDDGIKFSVGEKGVIKQG